MRDEINLEKVGSADWLGKEDLGVEWTGLGKQEEQLWQQTV